MSAKKIEHLQIIDNAVEIVLSDTINSHCVELMKLISSSTEASETFVRTLVSKKEQLGECLDTILVETQQLFERVAEESESTACTFMCYLWLIAGEQIGLHDVCNSIDLWLANTDRSKIMIHLKHIASNANDEVNREHFRQLADL